MTLSIFDNPAELLLSADEEHELAECEAIIERGLKTFVDVGQALLRVRDKRLYRKHGTFDDYCQKRWQIKRSYAYELIDAASVVGNLYGITDIPQNPAQVRPLTQLPPEAQSAAWQRAVETAPNGRITAAHVRKTVDEITKSAPHVTYNSGNNEWYTPAEYIAAARNVMGDIDLDPASSDIANATIGAQQYYTIETDGLSHAWYGRVWMNPPYANDLVGKFTSKLANHVTDGDVTEAIVLVNNATETGWFANLINVASAICFTRGRIRYLGPKGVENSPLQGQAFIYIGNNIDAFRREFGPFGWTATL